MVPPLSSPPPRRISPALLIALMSLGALLPGCQRDEGPDLAAETTRLKTDLESTAGKLSTAEKSLEAKNSALDKATAVIEAGKSQLAEKDQAAIQRDAQLRALQLELDTLRKRDAFVFAEITTLRQQGQGIVALSQYQKFLTDFPNSPLAPSATTAVAELTTERTRDSRKWADKIDPKRAEKEILSHFGDGLTTLAELAPLLKKKTLSQVVAMLGRPNQTFNEGTEVGYTDKAFNPATNRKGMLIIGFESGEVSTLRIDYAGRKMIP